MKQGRIRHALGAISAWILLACALPAAAGEDPGIRLGYFGGTDADDPVPVIGVYARFDIPGPLNLEVSGDYRHEKAGNGDLESTVIPLRASVVFSPLPGISPYILAGGGISYAGLSFHNEFSDFGDEKHILFETHAGAGLEIALGPLNLVGDLRYIWSGKVSSDNANQILGHDYDPSGWYAGIAAGIMF